jgi:hypothetical protein
MLSSQALGKQEKQISLTRTLREATIKLPIPEAGVLDFKADRMSVSYVTDLY